ncbi:MAG: calcium-binding protein, partial [Symploca sp. SIO2G7]|nr:calcium-binding protein [Symploca sp. SIO2G7]
MTIATELDDLIIGDGNDNEINGQGGNDTILGGVGLDLINGGSGNDTIAGGLDVDTVIGGAGDDIILISDGEFIDNVDGGTGFDSLILSPIVTPSEAVFIDLSTNTFTGFGGTTTVTGIEQVIGTQGADTLIGDGAD